MWALPDKQKLCVSFQSPPRAMCVLHWGASLVPTVLGCNSGQLQAGLWNLASMHVCPEESANCEKGRENTEGLMTGKWPTRVVFIWITEVWWNLLMPGWSTEFTILRISFVLSTLLRDGKVEVKKNRELLWLYMALLAPKCGINTARMGVPEDSYSWCPKCKPFRTLEG